MLFASAKAILISAIMALGLIACLAGTLLVWILLPEARPHMRAFVGHGRRVAFQGFAK